MTLRGIDVSTHQRPAAIDWNRLAISHRFVIARATYGTRLDTACAGHVECARSAGLTVGLYHFFRPQQSVEEQLAAFERAASVLGMGPGWLLPALDIERNEQFDGAFTRERYDEQCRAICEAWRQRYGGAIVYTNPADWVALGSPEWLQEYHLWIAHWGAPLPTTPLGMPWAIWQSRVAPLPGIYDRDLDQNEARSPLPIIPPVDDYDAEEETTAVTRAALTQSAAELRSAVETYLADVELERDEDAERKARDRLVSEPDEP